MRHVTSKMPEGEAVAVKFMLSAGRAELLRDGFTARGTRGRFLLTFRCCASLD
jgi:hypothetical protein